MTNSKINALVNFLGEEDVNVVPSEYNGNVFIADGNEEYLVLTEEEADQEFYNYQKDLIDDMGIDSFSQWAQDYILDNFVDSNWFDEYLEEYYQFYIDDIRIEDASTEDFNNRLEEEINENGCDSEEEYFEMLIDEAGDSVEWYKEYLGTESLNAEVKDNNLIDYDRVIEWVQREYGRGCLASYDGAENEEGDFYIYRIN